MGLYKFSVSPISPDDDDGDDLCISCVCWRRMKPADGDDNYDDDDDGDGDDDLCISCVCWRRMKPADGDDDGIS